MLRKCSLVIVFLFFFLGIPKSVFAGLIDVGFTCSEEVMIGGTVSCKISLMNSSFTIKGIQANHKFDESFSYVKTISGSNWNIVSAHSEGLMLTNLDGVTENSDMAQVDFLVSNQASVGKEYEFQLNNILLTDGEKDLDISNKISKVKVLSVLDVLESLNINGETLEVKDGITNYTVYVENNVDRAKIEAVLKNDRYLFDEEYGPREITDLKVGENEVKLKILSGDQELITFTVVLNRSAKEEVVANVDTNPKTGNFPIFMVIIVMISSIGVLVYFQRKNSLKEG